MENQKSKERLERIFPAYFKNFDLPEGAREQLLHVYRACRSGKCDADSFMSTFEEKGCVIDETDDETDPSLYSLSTYEKPNHIKRFASMDSDMRIPYKIAIGVTDPAYGLAQRTKERKSKSGSHVDWWLYQGAAPYKVFTLIPDFEQHLKEYIEKRDEKNE